MTRLRMTLLVNQDDLATILGCVKGVAQIVSILPDEEKKPAMRSNGYTGGKRNKGIGGRELFLRTCLAHHPRVTPYRTIIAKFKEFDFADSSASPVLSELKKEGLVTLNADNDVILTSSGYDLMKNKLKE